MNKFILSLFIFAITIFTINAFAFTAPPAPDRGWYVVDQTGRMTASEIDSLNQKILRVSQATHNEFGVALIQSLDGDSIEDAAYSTFQKWGIGKHGLDNGVLIIVSLKDRKSRIETGKGVGGEITDIQSKQILDNTMRPKLKVGHFAEAFGAAIDDLGGLMESRANQKSTPITPTVTTSSTSTNQTSSPIWLLLMLGLLLMAVVIIVWNSLTNRKRQREEDHQKFLEQEEQEENRRKERLANNKKNPTVETSAGYDPYYFPVNQRPIVFQSLPETPEKVSPTPTKSEHHHHVTEHKSSYTTPSSNESSSSNYGSSSSTDSSWGSSSSFDSGGGFGGGDSGGGGSSSDW